MKTIILTLLLIPTLSFASIDSNLRLGNKGAEVTKLQTYLVEKGYNTQVTGYFGVKTLVAVKKFQLDNEIPSTGYVGPLTRKFINTPIVATPAPVVSTPTASTPTPVVSTSTPTQPVPPTVSTPLATTTATTLPTIPPVYNKPMNEISIPTITFGTPFVEYLKDDVYRGYIPVTISDISNNTVLIDGTIPEPVGTGLNGIGREFNKRSKQPYLIPLEQVRGNYSYTITIRNFQGQIISETSGSMNIPKFQQEL